MLRQFKHDRRSRPRTRVRQVLVLLTCLLATAYFAYHGLYGRHGLSARDVLIERASLLDFEIKSLETVRSKLERDVALLAPELPHPDLVEEIARDVLGYVRATDKILPKR